MVEIKQYKSITKKKKKNHDEILSLARSKINSAKDLISKVLIDLNISHDQFALINNVPKEFNDMQEAIKKSNDK